MNDGRNALAEMAQGVVHRLRASWRSLDSFALIIGGMKCGTTSLYQYLSAHPHVGRCRTKEPGYFSAREYAWSLNEYQSLWPTWNPNRNRIALEASTHYTKLPAFPNAAARIADAGKESQIQFRFIYLMRNPFDRIESWYRHHLSKGKPLPASHEKVADHAVDMCRYWTQANEYYSRFPADRIRLLKLDALKARPASVLQELSRFLGIDDSFAFDGAERHHNTSRRLLWIARIKPKPSRPSTDLTWSLSESQRDDILARLSDDLARLSDEHGIDVSDWIR